MPRARLLGLVALLAIPLASAVAGRAAAPSVIVFSADEAPRLSYEIYRLDPSGHRVDLSQSASEDWLPLVSPDGKQVAFFSFRSSAIGEGPRLFEVRTDGTHVENMGPSLTAEGATGSIAWQPHGDLLAAVMVNRYGSPNGLWVFRRGHPAKRVIGHQVVDPSWSPDGRVLVAWVGYAWQGFSPAGKRLWLHESKNWRGCCGVSWSARGLFAITTRAQLRVYDESGRKAFATRVTQAAVSVSPPSWSPDGRKIGFVAGGVVEVRTASGRLVLRKSIARLDPHKPNQVAWASDDRLVAGLASPGRFAGIDVHTGKLWQASDRWLDPRSADGRLAIVTTPRDGESVDIGVAPVRGGATKVYGHGPDCGPSVAVGSLQFVGRSRSIVYASVCGSPARNLYSMAPDGSGLHEIAGLGPYTSEPALSPDGTEVTYLWTDGASCNTTCGAEIRVANIDGTGMRVLVQPTECAYENSPTWSPDGKTILYSEGHYSTKSGSCMSSPEELYTLPAAGGPPPRDLGVAGGSPVWGPTRIAYFGAGGLTTANPDGSDPVVVAQSGGAPAWSPDGRLAYRSGVYGTTVTVGSTQVNLPFAQVNSLAWSPDGTRFVVAAKTALEAQTDVYTVRTDGTDPVRLTTDYDASGASWR